MRYGSVCSGVEAASLAWMPLGWECVFVSEVEPFPCTVLKERFPDVPNLGDMTKIKVENVENGQQFTGEDGRTVFVPGGVDLLVGGTPCQGFSVAGKMGGVNDLRSRLCLTYIDLLKTMRPRWFVWENVPGVFSTNGGEDFRQFIREIDEIGYSLAWRVLDAQYVRVDGFPRAIPQRRRRVFVVGCLMGWTYPAAVLFEPDCVFGNTPPRRIKGKGFAGDFTSGTFTSGMRRGESETGSRKSGGSGRENPDENGTGTSGRPWDETGVNPTLNQCNAGSGAIAASNQEIFSQNCNGLVMQTSNGEDVADTLDASYYKGVGARNGNERTVLCAGFNGNAGAKASLAYEEEMAPTLLAKNAGGGDGTSCYSKASFGNFDKGDGMIGTITRHEGCSPDHFIVEDEKQNG